MRFVLGRDDLADAVTAATATATAAPAERVAVKPVHKASKGFVNAQDVDLCELAIVTMLQAAAYDKPVVLLPLTTLGRTQHQTLVTMSGLTVHQLAGHSVGVRSWSQTTGVWVRGFLTDQYGVDLRDLDWVSYEDGHIDEYRDPRWVRRAEAGAKLPADFLAGRVDFGIMGNELPDDDRIRRAIPEAAQAAEEWSRTRGFIPVNHVTGVSEQGAREHADAILAAYDAVSAVLAAGERPGPVVTHPVGFAGLRNAFTLAATWALEQGVLPRKVDYDELVERSSAALGVSPARLGA